MPGIDTIDERIIAAPPAELYDIILDYPRMQDWYPRYKVTVVGGGPVTVGTRLQHELSPPGSPIKSRFQRTILATERPRSIEESYDEGDLVGRGRWEFEDLGDGRTRVAFHCAVRSNRLLMHVGFLLAGERGHHMVYEELLAALDKRAAARRP
jgi:uncharacterized protein YndB with AHSA1/START domain